MMQLKQEWLPIRGLIEDLRYVISQTNVTDMYNFKD